MTVEPAASVEGVGASAPNDRAVFAALTRTVDDLGAVSFLVESGGGRRWVSENWTRIYGGDREEFADDPRGALERVHPDDRASAEELMRRIAQRLAATIAPQDGPLRQELRLRAVDGAYRSTEVRADVVRAPDGRVHVMGTIGDATELHDTREALAAMTLAEAETNRSTADFVSKMSHELRTPLHAVLGYAQLLETGAGDAAEYSIRLRRAGDHLVQLLDDLLDFGRLNLARLAVADEDVDIGAVVDSAIEMTSALAHTYEVAIVGRDDVQASVRGDATRLRQVLANLLSNAIKYNRPDGSVAITTSCDGDLVFVDVEDTGPGIAPELIPRLFVPFDRMGAEAGGVTGVGLGLPLTEGLVRAMGGAIEVTSTLGVGTRVRAILRRAGAPAVGEAHPTP